MQHTDEGWVSFKTGKLGYFIVAIFLCPMAFIYAYGYLNRVVDMDAVMHSPMVNHYLILAFIVFMIVVGFILTMINTPLVMINSRFIKIRGFEPFAWEDIYLVTIRYVRVAAMQGAGGRSSYTSDTMGLSEGVYLFFDMKDEAADKYHVPITRKVFGNIALPPYYVRLDPLGQENAQELVKLVKKYAERITYLGKYPRTHYRGV